MSGQKPPLWTKNYILLCLSSLTFCLAFHSLIPTLPLYIKEQGGSSDMAGLAMAALTVAAVLIRPIAGWALDRYGRKAILLAGLLVFLIPSFVYSFMIPIVPLLLLRFVQGFGWGVGTTAQSTLVSDIVPSHRMGEGLGYYGLANSISLGLGPALGLWLIASQSFSNLFVTSFLLTTAALGLVLLIKAPKQSNLNQGVKLVFLEKLALGPSFIILLTTITYSSLLSFLALFMQEKGLASTGWFFTFMAISSFASRPLAGKLIDKKGQTGCHTGILVGLFTIGLSLCVVAGTNSPWQLILAGCLFGLGFGFVQPTTLFLSINSVSPARRGAANATYWTAFDVGVALGSVLWGIIANHFGYATMFYLNIIPLLLALVYYLTGKSAILRLGFSKQMGVSQN